MPHDTITNTAHLHDPKSRLVDENPHWFAVAPAFNSELAVESVSGKAHVAYDATEGETGWETLQDSTRRLGAAIGLPSPSAFSGSYWPNIGAMHGTTLNYSHGTEADSGGDYTAYAETLESSAASSFAFYVAIPQAFSGWDTNGIRLRSRIVYTSGSADIKLEVMDPATGIAFGTPKSATRTGVVATETNYSWLTVSGATLGAAFAASDMLKIVVTLTNSTGDSTTRLSTFELNWN